MDGLNGTAACFSPGKAMSPQVIYALFGCRKEKD
jgi:hypothetical protein